MITQEELKKINIDFSRVGYDTETREFEYEWVEGDIENIEETIRETFPNGARYVGKYKWSNWAGGETQEFNLRYTTERLIEIMKKEGHRGALPFIREGKLFLPMEDMGGGIVTKMILDYKGDVE